ncbi:MAG: V-type ATP synthase subunit K [Treponema sp.]|nr:V-type ATP synthase subunit K [Treponema sp.]
MEVGFLGELGIAASFGLASIGAAIGVIANGPAAIGAWKKCYIQKKPAPFILLVFAATCLTNVIYGFITMFMLAGKTNLTDGRLLGLGVGTGLCIAIVAYTQAKCAAAAADAYAETGQGLGNYLMVIGIAETIGLFAMVFTIIQ